MRTSFRRPAVPCRTTPRSGPPSWRTAAIVGAILIPTVLVYREVGTFPYIEVWDDGRYVSENPAVRSGLTLAGLRWAFTTFHAANWHPVTWLSHMLDVSLFGVDAGWHHRINVLLHAANAIVLYLALARATGCAWRSGAVAALFAVHPLHVESVAWVSERKDLLCALFGFLAIRSYVAYAGRNTVRRYLPVFSFHALSLLSKPMLVTLPLLLLLLDVWPLGRFRPKDGAAGADEERSRRRSIVRLLAEKVPLAVLSLASAVLTILAQRQGGAVSDLDAIPFSARIGNALVSAVAYLAKAAWPSSLAAIYPHPAIVGREIPLFAVLGAGFALAGATWWFLRKRRGDPYLAFGGFWFLVCLLPVTGIVQVGVQSMADRYTYVPLVGVFVAAAWGIPAAAARLGIRKRSVAAAAAIGIVSLSIASARQVTFWRDGFSVFRRALAVTEDNWVARHHIGVILERQGDFDGASAEYREVLRLRPGNPLGYSSLGVVAERQGKWMEAYALHLEALRIDPGCLRSRYGAGNVLLALGAYREAAEAYREAVRLDPSDFRIRNNLGFALLKAGLVEEAVRALREADSLSFGDPVVRRNLDKALSASHEAARGAGAVR